MGPFFGQLVDEDKVGFEKARPNAPKRDSHIPVTHSLQLFNRGVQTSDEVQVRLR